MTSEREEHIADLRDRLEKVEGKIRQRRKDFWDKFQILAAMLTPAVIVLVGWMVQQHLEQNQQREETTKLVLDVIAGRELADTQIRAQMFESLLNHYFTQGSTDPEQRLTLLHLMQTNFVEYFNARPLFEALHDEIAGTPDEADIKIRMRKIARGIVDRQEMLVNAGVESLLRIPVSDSDSDDDFQEINFEGHRMWIKVTAVDDDKAHVVLKWTPRDKIDFDVNYYDMPLVDYTTLADGHRFALTFKGREIENGQNFAIIKAFEFDSNRLLPRDRPTMNRVYSFVKGLRKQIEDHEDDHAQDDEHGEVEPPGDVLADPLARQPSLPPHDSVSAREPGLYLKESVRRGEPIVETMLSIATANGDGPALDRPTDLADVGGGCFARDMVKGERLEWTDIGVCE